MYQSNFSSDNCLKRFTVESFGAAILDSGASKTVCGRMWIDCYTESLSGKETESVKHTDSKNSFKIGIKNVMIETDVVNAEIPLLLSKEILKKADAEPGFNSDLQQGIMLYHWEINKS